MTYEVWYDEDEKSWYLSTEYFTESYTTIEELCQAIKKYEKDGF